MKKYSAFAALLAPLLFPGSLTRTAATADTVEITEWTVPWPDTRPRDPYVDRNGQVWFVGQTGHYIARLDPRTGRFTRFELEPGTGPHNQIVDASGAVWYAGNRTGHIGRLDPSSGRIRKYPMPDSAVRDPHTLVFDQSGNIWFTAQRSGYVGKLTVATGSVQVVKIPGERTLPYGIVIDARGRPWFNEFGNNKIGMIDPVTMSVREFTLSHERTRSRRIALTSDGGVWYVDYTRGYLGRLDPVTGRVEEFEAPGKAASLPYAMAVDDRDRLWYVETGVRPNRLVGFDPRTRAVFSSTEIASGGVAVRHMVFHRPTRTIWFGTDAGTIGRAMVPR